MKFNRIVTHGISKSRLNPETWNKINALSVQNVAVLSKDSQDLDIQLKDADCLLVLFDGADRAIIDKASNLKYIGALATGVGKIDLDYAAKKSIVVTNIPGYSTESVAELVFAVLLENLREISRAKIESKQGNRSELGFSGREIKNKRFGVVGLGQIGGRVAQIALGFGADVYYWSKNRKPEAEKQGVKFLELDELLATSDILSLNLSLNSETENILNKEKITKIKEGAIVINTAPMELLDIDALEERLRLNGITFIFDHTDPGDISEENLKRLQKYDRCISYPVLGYISDEATLAKQEIFIKNMEAFLQGKPENKTN